MAISFKKIGEVLIDALGESLINQGHRHKGSLIRSMETRIQPDGVQIWGNFYSKFLQTGVKKGRIPYRRGRDRGGTSKYIQALIAYFTAKGKGSIAKQLAFATANKHAKEGMPTSASSRFSSTGKRTGYIDEINETKIFEQAEKEAEKDFELQIDKMIK